MTWQGWLQIGLYLLALILLVKPLGLYMTRVYQGEAVFLSPILSPIEKWLYRLAGIEADEEMTWKTYSAALLLFSGIGFLVLFGSLGFCVGRPCMGGRLIRQTSDNLQYPGRDVGTRL